MIVRVADLAKAPMALPRRGAYGVHCESLDLVPDFHCACVAIVPGISRIVSRQVSEVQMVLLSQISVNPKDIQAYYHLGGTGFLLAKHTVDVRVQRHQIVNPQMLSLMDEWSAASKQMLESMKLYAHDVAAESDHSKRLEGMWLEAQKL